MIIYNSQHRLLFISTLFHVTGSAIINISAICPAVISSLLALGVSLYRDDGFGLDSDYPQSYFTAISFLVGFVITYRAQLAFQRYTNALNSYHTMRSKLLDIVSMVNAFYSVKPGIPEVLAYHVLVIRYVTLYHKVMLASLRGDSLKSWVTPEGKSMKNSEKSIVSTKKLSDCPSWLSSGFQRCFCCKSECTSGTKKNSPAPGIVTGEEYRRLSKMMVNNRARAVLSWLTCTLTDGFNRFPCEVNSAVYSRIYQILSDLAVASNLALDVADSPFPFVYSQICAFMLWFSAFCSPIMFSQVWSSSVAWPACVSFAYTLVLFAVNLASVFLENPFSEGTNGLPMLYYEHSFDHCVVS